MPAMQEVSDARDPGSSDGPRDGSSPRLRSVGSDSHDGYIHFVRPDGALAGWSRAVESRIIQRKKYGYQLLYFPLLELAHASVARLSLAADGVTGIFGPCALMVRSSPWDVKLEPTHPLIYVAGDYTPALPGIVHACFATLLWQTEELLGEMTVDAIMRAVALKKKKTALDFPFLPL